VAVAAVSYFAILWLIGARILRESIEELLALLRKRWKIQDLWQWRT